jgi:hypothetical protein
MSNTLGEVLTHVVSGPHLQGFAVAHQTLERVRVLRTGELLAVGLASQ